jgi:hypothetical protein
MKASPSANLEKRQAAYQAFHNLRTRQWNCVDDLREATQDLQAAIDEAKRTTETLARQVLTPDQTRFQGGPVIWITLAEATIKETAR